MANAMYGKGREAFGSAGINWVTDVIKAQLVDLGAYTVSIDTHEALDDIPALARIGDAATLTSKTNTLGVLDAADASLSGMVDAPTGEALVIYKHTGVEATSTLIVFIDTAGGLPTAPGVTAVSVEWDDGPNKILKL